MAYFEFLAGFIGIPALFVTMLNSTLHWKGTMLPRSLRAWPSLPVVGGHLLLALLYTTPWDNYLVATSVWWYDPALVVGTTLGYVPVEEYLFFIGQTFLVGTAFLAAARLLPPFDRPFLSRPHLRLWSTCLAMSTWMYGIFLLGSGNVSGTYLGLELAWGLIPISFQLGFGADIIWHYRRPVVWTLVLGHCLLVISRRLRHPIRHLDYQRRTVTRHRCRENPAFGGIHLLFHNVNHGRLWCDSVYS